MRSFFGNFSKNIIRRLSGLKKRYRILISTFILTLTFLYATFFPPDKVFLFFFVFIILSYLSTYFSILENIEGVEWFSLFVMPVVISMVFYIFYFLFPGRWLTRIPFLVVFSISFYAILLSNNILNTTVEKNIQLYRAAFSVNYLFQSISFFLFGVILFSLFKGPLVNFLAVFLFSFLLSSQFIWSITLKERIDLELLRYVLLISFLTSQVALILSFAPVSEVMFGLTISAFFYFVSGYVYLVLEKRLFPENLREFWTIISIVVIILLFSLRF